MVTGTRVQPWQSRDAPAPELAPDGGGPGRKNLLPSRLFIGRFWTHVFTFRSRARLQNDSSSSRRVVSGGCRLRRGVGGSRSGLGIGPAPGSRHGRNLDPDLRRSGRCPRVPRSLVGPAGHGGCGLAGLVGDGRTRPQPGSAGPVGPASTAGACLRLIGPPRAGWNGRDGTGGMVCDPRDRGAGLVLTPSGVIALIGAACVHPRSSTGAPNPVRRPTGSGGQSMRWVRSMRSCRSWASRLSVAIGRASSRRRLMGSWVSSQ